MITQEQIMQKLEEFLALAKELNYDPVALYDKDPLMMQILGGSVVAGMLVCFVVGKMISKPNLTKLLQNLENDENDFYDYQHQLAKLAKALASAKPDFLEQVKAKKESIYERELATLTELSIDAKIERLQEMAKSYAHLGDVAGRKDEELGEFYSQKAQEILNEKLKDAVRSYMEEFEFNEDGIRDLEAIVTYANTLEDPYTILNIVTQKLDSVDFGASLDVFTFVRALDEDGLVQIYDYCIEKQNKLFEDGNSVIGVEILEYLIENDEKEKVLEYVKSLTIDTYLQELNYRYFGQGDEEFDLAFIANPTPINRDYANYLESKFTAMWRDADGLETLLGKENVQNVIGHDRARKIIERIDELRENFDAKKALEVAQKAAQEAKELVEKAKELVSKKAKEQETKESEVEQEVETLEQQTTQEQNK